MKLREVGEGVFIADEPIVRIGHEEIEFLKQQANICDKQRARICAHKDDSDALHEMFIAMIPSTYIHPHKHIGKSEAFHIVEGEIDVIVFDEEGAVREVIELGDSASGRKFYYRIPESIFHTLIIRTDFLVVHEVTSGPLIREQTILAPFAPPAHDGTRVRDYMAYLSEIVVQQLGG